MDSVSPFSRIKYHSGRWYGQVLILLIVFFSVRIYMQRNVVSGVAPDFSGSLLNGTPVHLQSLHGKPVLVHFWATWCPVCKLEHSGIQALSRDYQLVTIAMNSGVDMEVQSFMQEQGLDYPVLADPEGILAQRYGVRGVPTSFFVDADGRIRFVEVGFTSEWGMRLRLWWLS